MTDLIDIQQHRKRLLINGVYSIRNIITNDFYIGSCSNREFIYRRVMQHLRTMIKGTHHNKYLQNAVNKYGIKNFILTILEECTPDECIAKEQQWIDTLRPQYNLCKTAGSSLGRKFSEETKKKMSEIAMKRWENNPELRDNMSKVHKGKKLTEKEAKGLELGRGKKNDATKQTMSEKRKEYWLRKKEADGIK